MLYIECQSDESIISRSFKKEMSRQLSPIICKMITDSYIQKAGDKLMCISFKRDTKFNSAATEAYIEHRTQPFILCNISISWYFLNDNNRDLSEEYDQDSIRFLINISQSEKNKLNYLLTQLYHPVIKSAESGLPYDYQIFFGGSKLRICLKDVIDRNIECMLNQMILGFFESHNLTVEPWNYKRISKTNSFIWYFNDSTFSAEIALDLVRMFKSIDKIKKVVLE